MLLFNSIAVLLKATAMFRKSNNFGGYVGTGEKINVAETGKAIHLEIKEP